MPAACAPGQSPVDRMDAFFDSLNGRNTQSVTVVTPPESEAITTRPGYAPAYPPYQVPTRARSEPASSGLTVFDRSAAE